MTPHLVVVGSINVDLFAHVVRHPSPGETVLGDGGGRAPGGKGANQALAAALQGAAVRFVGAVGDDPDADVALRSLREAAVGLHSVHRVHGPTGLAIITVAEDGENTIVVIAGANASVTPQHAQREVAAMTGGDILLLQGELRRDTTEAAARAAVAAGHRVVLNVAPWGALDADVLTAADPLVLNEHEAALAVDELALRPGDHEPRSLAEALVAAGTPSVVVTLGAAGAVLVDARRSESVPSPRVDAVDTTGAGDAFTGALAARLLAGDDLLTSVRRAVRVGAYAVQQRGAQPSYPSLEDVLP